ncbi:MAG: hypothetical protein EXS09_14505 [Gemmataceae bacterium]|nr:hypothetical protein [Gemmataceae bacterium]
MDFDLNRVRLNVRESSTEDLLDRATVYRAGIEQEALALILEELRSRGYSAASVVQHEQTRAGVLCDDSGTAMVCVRCPKPAVVQQWVWHRLFGKVPLFPRYAYLCEDHRTPAENEELPPPQSAG